MRGRGDQMMAVEVDCEDVRHVKGRPRAIEGADGVWKNEPYVSRVFMFAEFFPAYLRTFAS